METEYPSPQISKPTVNYDALLQIGKDLLIAIGQNPGDAGVKDTPRRFADMWKEFIEYQPGVIDTTFESIATNQMVIVSGMRVWSVCEHHLIPFWCDISIAYIARDKVLGLSKFARVAHKYAHKPQLQERLVQEIADEIGAITNSPDIAVIARGQHLCMVMRGIRTDGIMTSSVMRGVFFHSPTARQELLSLIANN